jgi:hypothetical protein
MDELDKEFEVLTDEIEWDLKAINEGSVVINTETNERAGDSDLAIEIAKDASRFAEILIQFEKSEQYDPEADK